jgi:hypothetical protein
VAKKLLSTAKGWIGATDPHFDTYIPSLADPANIEDALKIFMYGNADAGGYDTVDNTSLYSNLLSIKQIAESADDLISEHNSASVGVHGLSASSSVVGTSSIQTLSNKTLQAPVISGGVSISGNTLISGSVSVSGNIIGHIDILDKTSAYTLALVDDGKLIQMNSASANVLSVPLNSSVQFPIGTQIILVQTGTGQTSIAGEDPSVVINATPGLKLRARYSAATLIKTDTNKWLVIGDMTS